MLYRGFNTFENGGASTPRFFIISGLNLTGVVQLAVPTSFEISTQLFTGFSSLLTLPQINGGLTPIVIYVRQKSSLPIGLCSDNINISTAGMVSLSLSCTGNVSAVDQININTNASQNVDLRIANKYGAVNKSIYSVQDHTNHIFTRSIDCWAADLDLTCMSPSNSQAGNLRAGTLITPRHCILAAHFTLTVNYLIYL